MVFVPPYAPLVALAFLGTGFLIVAGTATALFGALSHRRAVMLSGLGVAAVVGAGYGLLWAGSGLASQERSLAPGGRKYFCEIDCHLAYSVKNVERLASLGPDGPAPSNGEFVVVTLETWFDPSTTSPQRPRDVPLYPNPRVIVAADAAGSRFAPRLDGTAALVRAGRASTPVTEPLKPGDSYPTLLVFDVPKGDRGLRLYVGSAPAESAFLLFHEASPLAKKAWFALD